MHLCEIRSSHAIPPAYFISSVGLFSLASVHCDAKNKFQSEKTKG